MKHVLGMISPKLAHMPLVMKKFVRALNMFPSSLFRHIYKNSSLGHKNLIKAGKNGTRHALKLVWDLENWTSNENQDSFIVRHLYFVLVYVSFFICGICKLLCWYLIFSYKFARSYFIKNIAIQGNICFMLQLPNINVDY